MARTPSLKQIASIYTSDAYQALITKDESMRRMRYIYVPKKFEFGKTFFYEHKNENIDKGFILTPKEGISIQFISFLLNSIMTALNICDGNLNKTAIISKKILEAIPVRVVDRYRMFSLGVCNRIIQLILMRLESSPQNEVYQFHYNLFSEIRDGMSMELFVQPLFERFQIHIIDEWENLIIDNLPNIKITIIANQLMENSNELMNQIRKMRTLITNITVLLNKEKD